MSQRIKVMFNSRTITVPVSTSIAEILETHPHPDEHPALGAVVDNQLTGLGFRLRGACAVQTVDLTSKAGAEIYRRTAVLMLVRAAERLFPKCKLVIGQSIAHGYFFELRGRKKATPQVVQKIEDEMIRLRDADEPIKFSFVPVEEAIRHYQKLGLDSKVGLLRLKRTHEILMATFDRRQALPYGPLAMRTGVIHHFSLIPYEDGMVLRFPDERGRPVRRLSPQPKLFNTFRESQRWNEVIGVSNLSELNRAMIKGRVGQLIRIAEGQHEKKIVEVAELIRRRRPRVSMILISGPSASGKTTTSKRLEIQLRVNGITPINLSLDNYFLSPERSPKNPDGSPDFEHLEALDLPYLQEQLQRLIQGEKVETPLFDFATNRRRPDHTLPLQVGREQILVVEGIHALNPRLTENIDPAVKFKFFVSALTQLTIDEHNRIFTADARLIRRIVRDRLFRSYTAQETIGMWDSVRRGERKWIFPFQEDADVLFNSALVYEQAVLSTYARRFLSEVHREDKAFVEVDRLMNFLDMLLPILPEEVPGTSLLREFIGGSVFSY